MTTHLSNWLTIREAALAIGVSELTIRRRIKDGRIPHRLVAGKYYVDLVALQGPGPSRNARGPAYHLGEQTRQRGSQRDDDRTGDQVVSQTADRSAFEADGPELNGAQAEGASRFNLEALLVEHARLAELAGRSKLLEEQLRQLQERYAASQEGTLALANRNGWLESRLEERERELKLLADSRRRRPWWKRLFGVREAST